MRLLAVLYDIFGTDEFQVAVGAVIDPVLRIPLEGEVVPQGNVDPVIHYGLKLSMN